MKCLIMAYPSAQQHRPSGVTLRQQPGHPRWNITNLWTTADSLPQKVCASVLESPSLTQTSLTLHTSMALPISLTGETPTAATARDSALRLQTLGKMSGTWHASLTGILPKSQSLVLNCTYQRNGEIFFLRLHTALQFKANSFVLHTVASSFCSPVSLPSGCTTTLGLLYRPKHSIQHRFNNTVPLIKRQRSLTEAVLMSFGSTISFPKTLQRWRASASQQHIICCTVSVSILQNLQVGIL